jgi:cytochrome oxidase Cu insertion factor (SCO1/SenC/PrrC family)
MRASRSISPVLVGLAIGSVLLATVFAAAAFHYRSSHANAPPEMRPTGTPASVSTSLANLMQLSPVPVRTAPDFTLVDQTGRTMSLSGFRGRAVILEFTDPHCTDVCPIVSQELVDANRDLGTASAGAVFLAVNVNQYHLGVADMAAYSQEHQLNSVPSWHFFTGLVSDLQNVWRSYGIEVDAPTPTADVVHSDTMYFIDPGGRERYIATPLVAHTPGGIAYLPGQQIASWGQGIAAVAHSVMG